MDNNTLLFQDKGSGRFKDVKIYPNRIEVLKKGTFGGKHTEIVYLKDITGVSRIKGRDVFLRNRLVLGACERSVGRRGAELHARQRRSRKLYRSGLGQCRRHRQRHGFQRRQR